MHEPRILLEEGHQRLIKARHGYVLDEPAAPAKRGRTPARPAEADLDGSTAVDEPEG